MDNFSGEYVVVCWEQVYSTQCGGVVCFMEENSLEGRSGIL